MYACLAVTCHLHFWQNDRDYLRATAVTRGWNGYRNKSQHRKSTLENKILPPFQQGFEPATFQSRVRRSNHWAIPAPLSDSTWVTSLFYSAFFFVLFFYIHWSGHGWHGWCHLNLLPSRSVLCTPYNQAPSHFMQSHIRKVYACLAATYHLHFWQDDRDLLRVTAVARGWNWHRNKSQHRKSTLDKNIFPPLPQEFEPATFQSRVRRSNHWAIPAPITGMCVCKPAQISGWKRSFQCEMSETVCRCWIRLKLLEWIRENLTAPLNCYLKRSILSRPCTHIVRRRKSSRAGRLDTDHNSHEELKKKKKKKKKKEALMF